MGIISKGIEKPRYDPLLQVVRLSYGALFVPNMYRRSFVSYGKTVFHHSYSAIGEYQAEELCFCITNGKTASRKCLSYAMECTRGEPFSICEYAVGDSDKYPGGAVTLFNTSFTYKSGNVTFARCPNSEAVQLFLSCYPHHACGPRLPDDGTLNSCMDSFYKTDQPLTSVPVFTCSDDITRLSYTLVCDFRHHCTDGSDETFCQYPPCAAFACSNGQCVSYIKRCDTVSDCLDDSDELICNHHTLVNLHSEQIRSPVLISFDTMYSFKVRKMTWNETCPETHYRCPGVYNDCLPVYTLCNGLYDCIDHEDEEACENMTCPGFYRCFNSTVCVHADHLCDGWPHCSQGDDELLCNMVCPAQCLCQGHVFLCSKPFSAFRFPHLRYLNAWGSGLSPSDLDSNFYMLHLCLSNCSLNFLPVMTLPNLQFLDLSVNNLTVISMRSFYPSYKS